MEKGLLIILSGPSGVGKGTVRQYLMEDSSLNLVYSVSCTTREPRDREVDGRDYFFISKEQFLKGIDEGLFYEHAQFCGNYYGTPKSYVEKLRNEGKNVIVEIETNGARQLISKMNHQKEISIYIMPPDFEELERRIRGRKTETEDVIMQRLYKAREEIKLKDLYDYNVTNITPEQCAGEIKKIIIDCLAKN